MFCFIGNFWLSTSIDSGTQVPFWQALVVNILLIGVFGVQHTVMARPGFKAVWTRIVPVSVERSTYLLFSCAAVVLMFWKWQPMGGMIWNVENGTGRLVLNALYVIGWATVLITTFLINHFDLFGLRQVWLRLLGRPYTGLVFRTPGPYRIVRHPLYVGWLMVFWSAPVMTAAHLVFAVVTSAYILIAIRYEERDLVELHPEYAEYRRRVPMLMPNSATSKRGSGKVGQAIAKQAG
jgi:protein-S-isoprenylcysteine O-methyltransferase Ste14